jgi:hypothetical protein
MQKIQTIVMMALAVFFTGDALGQTFSPALLNEFAAIQAEKTARTPAERKLHSDLLYLTREAAGRLPVAGAPHLTSHVSLEMDGRVSVTIAATPDAALRQAISRMGGTITYESARWKTIQALVPAGELLALAGREDVKTISKTMPPHCQSGSVTSEGDWAHLAGITRTNYGVDGTGIKIGVISDSCDYYTNSIASGDLPASFTYLPGLSGMPGSGEGTAMSEIIHDLAPGAQIVFASAGEGEASFADSILLLRSNGCQIIVDDEEIYAENPFQDDVVAQAINQVVASGALYFAAADNSGNLADGTSTTWEGDFVDGGTNALIAGGTVNSFSQGGTNYNYDTIGSIDRLGGTTGAFLYWSDEGSTSSNDYDLYAIATGIYGSSVVAASTDVQDGTQQPYETIHGVSVGDQLVIFKHPGAAARYLRLTTLDEYFPLSVATLGGTTGHAGSANCIGVAATSASTSYVHTEEADTPGGYYLYDYYFPGGPYPNAFGATNVTEPYSCDGPRKRFYNADGSMITPGNVLASGGTNIANPDLTAADGVSTSLRTFTPFFGTSAAAPHAAAIAALVWSAKPQLSNQQVRAILDESCLNNTDNGFANTNWSASAYSPDFNNYGHGILMANLALANVMAVSPGQPVITFSVSARLLTLSWPAANIGWRLLTQTNHLASGLSLNTNDWNSIAGSSTTNIIFIPLNSTNKTQFYRLVHP